MKEIIFKDSKIQKGHRIKIPKPIIDTLNLKEGQKIIIRFDISKKRLILEVENEK
jgi:bifunctional DNA-binding transcriptional regulator/antitoxin component of YhaV-PrlF toxin-antitoxin module